jgi:hypothetical protein
MPEVEASPTATKLPNGIFHPKGLLHVRSAACLVADLVIVYISNHPSVTILCNVNTYERRSIGKSQVTQRCRIALHLQKQLEHDIWFQPLVSFCFNQRARLHSEKEPLVKLLFSAFQNHVSVWCARSFVDQCSRRGIQSQCFIHEPEQNCAVVCHRLRPVLWRAIDPLLSSKKFVQHLGVGYSGRGGASAEGLQELITEIENNGTQTGGLKSAAVRKIQRGPLLAESTAYRRSYDLQM